ncbi:MAG: aldehyde dehydrogenase [Balneolaceae bacterium]|nr:aldehyde dehydrogenase [Balneolaceae bacterium]
MTIKDLIETQKAAFREGVTRPYEKRLNYLRRLREMVADNEEELCSAINRDFGKPYFEAYTSEIYTVLHDIDVHIKNLRGWMKPEPSGSSVATFPSSGLVHKQPLGTVLVIGAWNYPVNLTLMPLIGAISGGNTAVLKPSELAPESSALLADLIGKYFENQVLAVVEGAVEETQELLAQPFNHIFFTGSTRVGKIVMKAAAEQLIPVTLELGGKSPAIVHTDADIPTAARRIWWGKTMNAGQICVAPDFALVHEEVRDQFIEESKTVLGDFFRDDYITGKTYTKIVNYDHFNRLNGLLNSSNVIFGGMVNEETRFIEPTLIDASWDDEIMQEEIFGPLLPLLSYRTAGEMASRLTEMSEPLALYLFTEDSDIQNFILEKVPFGGGCINDTISHLANANLPFGGVGQSGMGSYHGKQSFETFSRKQSVLRKPVWPDPGFRYPPYDEAKLKWFKKLF